MRGDQGVEGADPDAARLEVGADLARVKCSSLAEILQAESPAVLAARRFEVCIRSLVSPARLGPGRKLDRPELLEQGEQARLVQGSAAHFPTRFFEGAAMYGATSSRITRRSVSARTSSLRAMCSCSAPLIKVW